MKYSRQKGFSLSETLVSMTLVGVLSGVLYPMVVEQGETKLSNEALEAMKELEAAYAKITDAELAQIIDMDSTGFIVGKLNYVDKITDGTSTKHFVSVEGFPYPKPCDDSMPCVILQSGAYLQYDPGGHFGAPGVNRNAVRFLLDPDGDGPRTATLLVVYYGGRVTTWEYRNAVTV